MNTQFRVITNPRKLDTAEAAAAFRVMPQTLRRALCVQGHYLGLRPVKLPNGRLLWDSAEIDALVRGEVQK
ncbi:MAG: hypothetical protein RBR77_11385 [Thauera sp.]|jgi:hypothetical protein|nr:hypothetical protein [Thauera sp.]